MRVTDAALFDRSQRGLSLVRSSYMAAQQRAMTGKRVNAPSDDPLAASLSRRVQARLARFEAHGRAIDAGDRRLQATDAALSQVGAVMDRIRQIAIQFANDTYGADERAMAAAEVVELKAALVSLGNTEVGGQHLFAGYRDAAAPFDAAGAYSGDGAEPELDVAPGLRVKVGVSGAQAFGVGAGVNLFATFDVLSAALFANDGASVRATIDSIATGVEQVADVRGTAGVRMQALAAARSAVERLSEQSRATQASLVEIDAVEAFSDLARAEHALTAAVQVASMLPPPGLAGGSTR